MGSDRAIYIYYSHGHLRTHFPPSPLALLTNALSPTEMGAISPRNSRVGFHFQTKIRPEAATRERDGCAGRRARERKAPNETVEDEEIIRRVYLVYPTSCVHI